MYPLLFLSTSHFSPHLNGIPIINRVPPVALTTSVPRPATGLPGYQSSVVSITIPSLDPSPKVQTEQVIRCSSIARLVHKTCLQGQASGLKKISTPRSASGSIFFATLAHTASTLSSCAPAHYAPVPLVRKVIGINYPTANTTIAHLQSLRLVLIAAWLLVLLHNAPSILTRGYSCPLKPL